MSLIHLLDERNDFNQLPFQNVNPNRRLFIDDVNEQFVWWDDTTGTELFRIPSNVDTTQLIEVLDFDFNDLNALPAIPLPSVLIAGIIPANKRVLNLFLIMDDPFVNPSPDELTQVNSTAIPTVYSFNPFVASTLLAGGVQQVGNQFIDVALGGINKNSLAQDMTLTFLFTGGNPNPQDFTAGRLRVVVQVSDFPL
jgi:hypothetical protein